MKSTRRLVQKWYRYSYEDFFFQTVTEENNKKYCQLRTSYIEMILTFCLSPILEFVNEEK